MPRGRTRATPAPSGPRRADSSSDPNFVAPVPIAWVLLQVVGSQDGPDGGDTLTATTFVQRLNTSGGVAPSTGCSSSQTSVIRRLCPTRPTTSSTRPRTRQQRSRVASGARSPEALPNPGVPDPGIGSGRQACESSCLPMSPSRRQAQSRAASHRCARVAELHERPKGDASASRANLFGAEAFGTANGAGRST